MTKRPTEPQRLIGPQGLVTLMHSDCGAYSGLDAYGADTRVEAQHHEDELRSTAAFLKSDIPNVEVQSNVVTLKACGRWNRRRRDLL
jgi:hypothetical protein